jgi:hypothetical protein
MRAPGGLAASGLEHVDDARGSSFLPTVGEAALWTGADDVALQGEEDGQWQTIDTTAAA